MFNVCCSRRDQALPLVSLIFYVSLLSLGFLRTSFFFAAPHGLWDLSPQSGIEP